MCRAMAISSNRNILMGINKLVDIQALLYTWYCSVEAVVLGNLLVPTWQTYVP